MQDAPSDVAVLAALPEEVAPLLRRIEARRIGRRPGAARAAGPIAGADLWTGTLAGLTILVAVTGIGRRRATAAATAVLDRGTPRRLVVVGVAGALTRDLAVGDLVVAEAVSRAEAGLLRLDGASVRSAVELGARAATIVTVDVMLSTAADRDAALRSLEHGGDPLPVAVDMESYDVAREAIARGVPVTVLRAISDTSAEELPAFLARSRRSDGSLDRRRLVLGALARPATIPALLELRGRVGRCAQRLADLLERLLPLLAGASLAGPPAAKPSVDLT